MSKKRIVFVTSSLKTGGGSERQVVSLAQLFFAASYEVTIIAYYREKEEYELPQGIAIISLSDSEKKNGQISKIKRLRWLRQSIKKCKPDLLYTKQAPVAFMVYLSTLFLKLKIIYMCSESRKTFANAFMLRHATVRIFQTPQQLVFFNREPSSKNLVIPNMFIPRPYVQHDVNSFKRIVMVGRLEPQKNYVQAIELFKQLTAKDASLSLTIYGAGRLKASLEALVTTLKLEKKVFFHPVTSNLLEVLSQYDVFLMTSLYEGLPNAMIEAMIVGLPVVSFDCPTGPRFLIGDHNERGILIKNVPEFLDIFMELPKCLKQIRVAAFMAQQFVLNDLAPENIFAAHLKMLESLFND
ncbi:MAG: glycosyltransferase [Erysipelotrichaceae bacterium]|jgi:glycosyltransferase involved in cell wall biosynthesis|nr:glycosyltransferase [Erysipelotrichaceae bacterium]